MHPQRSNRGEPPYYPQSRMSAPPGAMNSAPMFGQGHYGAGPPTNGGWGQPQAPMPPPKDSWNSDENTNSYYPSFQEPNQLGKVNSQVPPAYNPAELHTAPVPPNQLEHMANNNQYDQQQNSNQNWGWGNEWGWSDETPQTDQPDKPQELHATNQAQAVPSNYQGLPPDPPLGIESSFNSMSLANQNREEVPQPLEQQPWPQAQLLSPASTDDPGSFSRVSTWGSALDHGAEHGLSHVGSEATLYHPELGERNTYADGASFTDTTQPLQQLSSSQPFSPANEPPVGASQPILGPARVSLPPTNLAQPENVPLQREPPPSVLDVKHGESQIEPVHPESNTTTYPLAPQLLVPLGAKAQVPPMSGGFSHADGYHENSTGVHNQYGSAEYHDHLQQQSSLPASAISAARYSDSVSRSQSGTPSMERETERPDAEGGYENDQPVPVYQPPPPTSYVMPERKVPQESPAGSRPSSRQAVITPSNEMPMANPSSYQVQGDVGSFARPKAIPPVTGFYTPVNPPMGAPQVPPVSTVPPVARGSQEAVGSENGPPPSRADGSNAPPTSFPPSSQRMIPGSGSLGPFAGPVQQAVAQQQQAQHPPVLQQQQSRPAGSITPVGEQRIVTGFAKNDPVPVPSAAPVQQPLAPVSAPAPASASHQPPEEARSVSGSRSPPPPHRSETIGSENPRTNLPQAVNMPVGNVGVGNASADRSDDRISLDRQPERDRHDRDRDARNHERGGDRREDQSRLDRTERERDRDRNRDDYERERTRDEYTHSRYEDDEEERYSYRDRRFDHDRDRDARRYSERERMTYSRREYDDDRRSGFGPSERDRMRDQRRRDPRRSDYYLTEAEMYERSGGRRSSLYEGENNDPANDYNRSAYGFNTSRDGRRRDMMERSRMDDPYYSGPRPGTEMSERAISERDYPIASSGRRRDPRDVYYQDPRSYYGYGRSSVYDPYVGGYAPAWATASYNQYFQELTHAYKHNYPHFEELRLKNPPAYAEWYRRYFANQRYPPSVTTGPGTGVGSIATSEADRASVHSGRSSVNDDHPSMIANHSMPQTMRGSTTGLDQTHPYADTYQDTDPMSIISTVQDSTPYKFPCPHVLARFSGNGFLIRVLPNSPKEGVAAHVELHDLNSLLSHLPLAQETRSFPGPLVAGQSHKQEVAVFCQQKIRRAMDDMVQLVDRQSYILLWELLLLLLRQNGTIVGTDIAELLLKDHEILKEPVAQEATESPEAGTVVVDRALVSRHTEASVTRRFRELLLFGHKKDALEWAMTQGLWGHALFLASKMDQRTYSGVMIRFANGLALTDPLQTLYQLMSGRQPTAVTSCGDDKWGDWRPHLAMILSNSTTKSSNTSIELDKKSIVTLGDTLAARGFLYAAHFCYLVAQVEFGTYSNKASKLVLLSASTSLPFDAFATNEAIQCTEVYEYARQLASPEFVIPSFQPYKFLYATRLAEFGRPIEALQYCEAIGNVMARSPAHFSAGLMSQVCQMGSMLRYSDPQYLTENESDAAINPAWLTSLEAAISSSAGTPSSEDLTSPAQPQPPESETQASSDFYQNQQQSTDQDYGAETQLQQPYFIPSSSQEQQSSYYNANAGSAQPQSGQFGEESMTTPSGNEQESSFAFAPNSSQDYSSYGQNQYNNYSWQQPSQQQQSQQQQSPWSYNETPATNGGPSYDYWGQQSSSLIRSDKSLGTISSALTRQKSALHSEDDDDDEEDDESLGLDNGPPHEPLSPSAGGRPSFSTLKTRHVVFGGTFPIDRPMRRDSASDSHPRRPPASLLTIKQPRTFSIDEPIRESISAEASPQSEENNFSQSASRSLETSPAAKEESKSSAEEKAKAEDAASQGKKSGGWFGGWFKRENKPTPMKLPDDSKRTIIYDAAKKRWINTEEDNDESSQPLAPPPKDPYQSLPSIPPSMPGAASSGPASLGAPANNGPNRFGLKAAGAKRAYASNNSFAISKVSAPLLGATPTTPSAPQFFVPQPADQQPASDMATPPEATPMAGQPVQQPQQPSEPDRFMFNPAQMPPPMAPPGRPGLASRGRYPR